MISVMSKPTEVSPKARRRQYSAAEKIRILREADACAGQKGAVAALLRREGLYSSHLATWRKQRDAGQLGAAPRKRGPVPRVPDARDEQSRTEHVGPEDVYVGLRRRRSPFVDVTYCYAARPGSRDFAMLDTFDWLSPRYDQPQSPRALERWLRELGLVDISIDHPAHLTGRARRP